MIEINKLTKVLNLYLNNVLNFIFLLLGSHTQFLGVIIIYYFIQIFY